MERAQRPGEDDTTGPSIEAAARLLERTFATGRTRDIAWRRAQLDGIARFVTEQEGPIIAALRSDLGKSAAETLVGEIIPVAREAAHARRRLHRWARARTVGTPFAVRPGRSHISREPYGVCLILSAWNFPIQLTLGPAVAAAAAGNCALLKPSELAPEASRLMAERLGEYVDPEAFRVVEGGARAAEALLECRWNFIFYTGSAHTGRKVAAAAAKTLTPIALELGGKNPAVVLHDADIAVAARRIVWGRMMNAGQVCTAPDYVLADRSIEGPLLEALAGAVRDLYGAEPRTSPDFGRILNAHHVDRLARVIGEGKVVVGGEVDVDQLYVAPTVLTAVMPDGGLMQDEIFGPVLPVLPIDGMEAAIAFIARRPSPLAAYIFSGDARARAGFARDVRAGAVAGNDVVMQMTVPGLPFGGVGESGLGAYHGRWGFELFSHKKAVLDRGTWLDFAVRYPPYSAGKVKMLRRLL